MKTSICLKRKKNNKNNNNKSILFLLLLMVILTIISYLTTYPEALPLYQHKLFTIDITNYSIVWNGSFLIMCIISSIRLINWYKETRLISPLIMFDLNLIYFIPGFLMNAIFKTEQEYTVYYAFFWLILSMLHYIMFYFSKCDKRVIVVYLKGIAYDWFFNNGIVLVFSGFVLIVSLIYSNWRISLASLFDLNQVLENRASIAELNIHWIIWYPVLCASMILPIWFTRAYKEKKIWQITLIVVTICAMFSIGSNRIFLFMLLFSVLISVFEDDDLLLVKGIAIISGVVCLEYFINDGYAVMNIVRRFLVTPNGESRFYVDFFTQNAPDYGRQLLERWLSPWGLTSRYSTRIPAMIGEVYLGGSNCNTGLIGYSIANYGYYGLVIAPLLYVLSFRALDIIMKKVKYKKMIQTTSIVMALEITNCYGWTEYLILPSFLLLFFLLMLLMPPVQSE